METSILELATLVREVVGWDVGVKYGPPRQGDILKDFSGIRKAEQVLSWRPETPTDEIDLTPLRTLKDWRRGMEDRRR